jgi:hypothetical protein
MFIISGDLALTHLLIYVTHRHLYQYLVEKCLVYNVCKYLCM